MSRLDYLPEGFERAERSYDQRRENEAADGIVDQSDPPENCCPSCYTQTEDHAPDCEYHAERLHEEDADRRYDMAREDRYE